MSVKVGCKVWYWARRKGEYPHQKFGIVLTTNGKFARILLDGSPIIPIQTVAIKRLNERKLQL